VILAFPSLGVIQHCLQSIQCWMSWATNMGRTLHSPLQLLACKALSQAQVETVSLTVSISLLDSKWCKHLCTTVDYAEKHSIWQSPKVHFY